MSLRKFFRMRYAAKKIIEIMSEIMILIEMMRKLIENLLVEIRRMRKLIEFIH